MNSNERWMKMALRLARKGAGYVSPNPMVGAVLVKDNALVGKGYHQLFGGPHAEVEAIQNAGLQAQGSTLYVTLEPCTHYGKTPPCTQAIIKAGITRAVIAVPDPNPINTGKGIQILRQAGLSVEVGIEEQQARKLNEAFFKYVDTGLPFVIVKAASSLDGRIATREGYSKWITGEAARNRGKTIRSSVDAIIVGVNTVIADDPMLLPHEKRRRYSRIVLDTRLRAPISARVFHQQREYPTLVFTGLQVNTEKVSALERLGVTVVPISSAKKRVSIPAVLSELGRREIACVLVEGGGEVIASFLQSGCVDKLMLFLAGLVIGGNEAVSWVGGQGFARLEQAPRFHIESIQRINGDILLEATPRKKLV